MQTVYNTGSAISAVVNSGGLQTAYMGGVIYNTILNGGSIDNFVGVVSGAIINSGGVMATYGRDGPVVTWQAFSYDTIINSGGIELIGVGLQNQYGGEDSESHNAKIYGSQVVTYRTSANNAIIYNGGSQIVTLQGVVDNTIISSGGSLIASPQGFAANIIVSNGGNLIVSSGAIIRGAITLEDGGFATLYAGVKNDLPHQAGSIILAGNTNGGLTISGLADGGTITTVITVIDGFDGTDADNSDLITLAGIDQKDVASVAYVDANGSANTDYVTLTLTNNNKVTLNIIGAESKGYTLGTASDGSLTYEVCFLAGSMIKIPTGEVFIEDIRIADQVITFDYEKNKEVVSRVKWVGKKNTTVRPWLSDDEAGYPVRIVKDAIAEGVPYKDLLITAEHCLFFEGKFIPVRMLVNGSTIFYDYSITSYEYYHIETEKHSVIMVNGMLTESYLDTGNRGSFRQEGSFVLFNKQYKVKTWEKDARYPLTTERRIVEELYYQIKERAVTLGNQVLLRDKQLTNDPKLYLVTSLGQAIYPCSYINGKYSFIIPVGTKEVYISSRVSRFCDIIGPFVDDRHQFGVMIGDIVMMTKNKIFKMTDHLVQSDLSGWHARDNIHCRWTKGHALLRLEHDSSCNRVLVLNVLSSHSYFLENDEEDSINYQMIA